MTISKQPLRLNYNSDAAHTAFKKVMTGLPPSVELYLIGGSLRNALYREFHNEKLIQRDYDQVVTKGSKEYIEYLRSLGYNERPYPSNQDKQVVYNMALSSKAEAGDSYDHWLVLDLHTVDGSTIEENIKYNAGFTINGCAIKASDLFSKPWKEAIVEVLPTAVQDIKEKRLRINPDGYKHMPSNFYAMLRFMSVGFSAPTNNEVRLLLTELSNIEHSRFERNVKKVWDYAGSEAKARQLVRSLGIDIDVFDEKALKIAFSH